jgi:RNA polymerase sigma-70 factor (ECF subfamily)
MQAGTIVSEPHKARIVAFLPRLRRFCTVLARSEDGGDDLMQATVERTLARFGQWQAGTSLESWMFRIAQNIHIDQMRSQARRGTPVDIDQVADLSGDDGNSIVEARSDLRHVREALAALPDEQRALMALIVIDGRSYQEAASILEIPIGTVMSRLARGRKALASRLQGHAMRKDEIDG